MLTNLVAFLIFAAELLLVLVAVSVILMLEKRCFCAPKLLFVVQQICMFIYILFFLNPFNFEKESNEKIANDLVSYELLSSALIVLIYLGMLHTAAARSEISFLSVTFLFIAAFAAFVIVSVCEWTISNKLALIGSKLFTYQAIQLVLFVLITLCVIRLTIRQDTEKTMKLSSFVPYHVVTLISVILFHMAPRFAFFLAVLIGESNQEKLSVLKSFLFVTTVYNLMFVVLINIHDPEAREDMHKSLKLSLRSIRTGPLPRINVQEPTSSSALARPSTHTPQRSHIALNLMRNPLNSFNKLQRQSTLPTETERVSHLLVIPKQQYYTTRSNEIVGEIQQPEEILSSRSADEPGFKTIALLRRASMISMRLQGEIASDSEPQTLRSSAESLVDQVSPATSPPPPPAQNPPEEPVDVLSIFVTSTSTPSSGVPPRKKRAVDRIREILGFR